MFRRYFSAFLLIFSASLYGLPVIDTWDRPLPVSPTLRPWRFRVEAALGIIRKAYPEDVIGITYDRGKNDWRLDIRTETGTGSLYWAGGKLLPGTELPGVRSYSPFFYYYPSQSPDPAEFSPETIELLARESAVAMEGSASVMCGAFFELIYDGADMRSIEQHIRRIDFLGVRISVHRKIISPLRRVEQRIYDLAETDSAVRDFIRSVQRADGYNWRDVRSSSGRSFHSWGLAVDFVSDSWNRYYIYWKWIRESGSDRWMLIPPEQRWNPPDAVISAFESEGFIWGGKWELWDNMHFEYRPEILLFREMALKQAAE
ncbi:MAG: M15 family metallopeptidase [Spirochaetaceae bacterium]|jgi:hypothetical protein|nr:M15 family metallopeptidase [Spirochaetaceae bacterium]